jgi:cell division septal protein FtsQ
MVSVILLLCAFLFVAFEVLHLRYITVTGCEAKTPDEIISLSGLETGVSIFSVDTDKAMKALGGDPYIKPVSVTIVYPDRVNITVEERKEAAYIKKGGDVLIIDNDGWLLNILMNTDTVTYTQVLGLNLDEFTVGRQLGAADQFQLSVLSEVMTEADAEGLELVSIDVSIAADVILVIKEGFTVELGDDMNLKEKFSLIKSAASELKGMGKTSGIIDVASANGAYYREK